MLLLAGGQCDVFILDRLTLPGAIVEDGRESASYDCNAGL